MAYPNEKPIGEKINLTTLGVPGLSFMARYTHGDNIDGTHMPAGSAYSKYGYGADGEHHETDLQAKYVVHKAPPKICPCACVRPCIAATQRKLKATSTSCGSWSITRCPSSSQPQSTAFLFSVR